MEGVDFFETYALVFQWTTVRLMLILEFLLEFKSNQGYVTAAFLRADLGKYEKVFIEMLLGFEVKGNNERNMFLKLLKKLWIMSNPQSLLELHDFQYGIMWYGTIQYVPLSLQWK